MGGGGYLFGDSAVADDLDQGHDKGPEEDREEGGHSNPIQAPEISVIKNQSTYSSVFMID